MIFLSEADLAMRLAKSEQELAERASRFLKAELKRAGVTYQELAKRLKKHGPRRNGGLRGGQAKTRDIRGNVPACMPSGARIGRR
jgi:hypothetical protein